MPTGQSGSSPFKILAQLGGYAYVGVNVRGSGCSGGAFDLFETLQAPRRLRRGGDDRSAAVGRQGRHGRDLLPGDHADVRRRDPAPAPRRDVAALDQRRPDPVAPRPGWDQERRLRAALDQRAGQPEQVAEPAGRGLGRRPHQRRRRAVRVQHAAASAEPRRSSRSIAAQDYFPAVGDPNYPEGGDRQAPWTFADKINVPTFIAGAWQDEQTGGGGSNLLAHLTSVPPGTLEDHRDQRHARRVARSRGAAPPHRVLRLLREGPRSRRCRPPPGPPRPRSTRPSSGSTASSCLPTGSPATPTTRPRGRRTRRSRRCGSCGRPVPRPASRRERPIPVTETSYSAWPPPETVATPFYFQPDGKLAPTTPTVADGAWNSADLVHVGPGRATPEQLPGRQHLGREPDLRLAPTRRRQGGRVHHRSAQRAALDRRQQQRRPVAPVDRARHRPAGDAHRGAARRHRTVRAERLVARQPPQGRRAQLDRALPPPHRPRGRRGAVARR